MVNSNRVNVLRWLVLGLPGKAARKAADEAVKPDPEGERRK